ncbi:phosphoadenosine phosphosulfate sulfotransferase [Pseudomonas aeruginosa]|nr:phosphoadenosine phosphosulfate sulfotransferase [Pseudomonas aeruginosa]
MCMPQPYPASDWYSGTSSASVSPSRGGKDSSVTLQLALDVARELGRSPVDVLFIDLEGQYQATIDHVSEMLGRPDVRPWWVCLPLNLRNASSLEEPYWCCWEPGAEADWVRPLPKQRGVISDPAFFPFYRYRMEFEGVRRRLQRLAGQGRAYRVPGRHPFGRIAQSLPGGQAQEPGETMRLDARRAAARRWPGARATGPTRRR